MYYGHHVLTVYFRYSQKTVCRSVITIQDQNQNHVKSQLIHLSDKNQGFSLKCDVLTSCHLATSQSVISTLRRHYRKRQVNVRNSERSQLLHSPVVTHSSVHAIVGKYRTIFALARKFRLLLLTETERAFVQVFLTISVGDKSFLKPVPYHQLFIRHGKLMAKSSRFCGLHDLPYHRLCFV